jgi:hypothetical protein
VNSSVPSRSHISFARRHFQTLLKTYLFAGCLDRPVSRLIRQESTSSTRRCGGVVSYGAPTYNMTPRFVSSKLNSLFANNLYLYFSLLYSIQLFRIPKYTTQAREDGSSNLIHLFDFTFISCQNPSNDYESTSDITCSSIPLPPLSRDGHPRCRPGEWPQRR